MLTKNQVIATLDNLPDKFTLDEVVQQMYVLNKIEMARQKSKKGKTFSTTEARKKLSKWLK
jgi:hypothetical protein